MPQNNKPGRRLLRQLYGSWYRMRHNISIFARWCLFAVIIGVVVGAVGAAFEHALEWATETRQEYSWTLYFLPLVGVFIAFWYSKMDMPLERGTMNKVVPPNSTASPSIEIIIYFFNELQR